MPCRRGDFMEKLILIDGNSLINRAFYALPPLNNPKGEPVGAVYGFTTMLIKAISDYKPDYIAVAFDMHAPTFRHKLYPEYKAGRRKMPDDLASQLPVLKQLLSLMNIKILQLETYEADDIIGTLSRRFPVKKIILTGDRDSLQLVDEKTEVYLTKKGLTEILACTRENIREHFGLDASQITDYKALAGDGSDNIPGVPGVGEKTALDLLQRFGTLDGVYENLDALTAKLREKLIANRQTALLSKQLGTIDCAVPVACTLEECRYSFPFDPAVKRFFIDMSFKSLYKKEELFAGVGEEKYDGGEVSFDFKKVELSSPDMLDASLPEYPAVMAYCTDGENTAHITFDGKTEYVIPEYRSLLEPGISEKEVFLRLGGYFAGETKILLYDAKKILHKAAAAGIKITGYEDVRLMRFLCDQQSDSESLTEMLQQKAMPGEFAACGLWHTYMHLCEQTAERGVDRLYREVELPLIEVLFDMEKTGVLIDRDVLKKLGAKFSAEAERYAAEIYRIAGCDFNINSPKQLASVLFEKLNIPYPKKSKKLSTGADILEGLRGEYEIVDYVLRYRTVSKLLATYVDGLEKLIDETGRVHTEYKQMLTATGRLSSVEPNLQNIPVRDQEGKELRAMFIAGEGKILISADYSQIELRLMAHFSGDPAMLDIYNGGGDIHTMTASRVFGVAPEDVTPEMRRKAKAVNFGIIYGISDYGLSESVHCSVKDAKRFIELYFQNFPRVKEYIDKSVENAKKTGEVKTLLGRRRRIPELFSSNFMTRGFGERAAVNTPLQGSAADIIKVAMLKVYEKLKSTDAKLILQIHDELIVEAPDADADKVADILKECMENAVKLSLPLTVEVERSKSWIDC